MRPEMSKREQRCLGGHLISLDKIGPAEWPGDKGDGGGRKTAGRGEMCVRRYRAVLAAKRVRAYELNLSSLCFSRDASSATPKGSRSIPRLRVRLRK